MQPRNAKMPGRDRKPNSKGAQICIIQENGNNIGEIFEICSVREHRGATRMCDRPNL